MQDHHPWKEINQLEYKSGARITRWSLVQSEVSYYVCCWGTGTLREYYTAAAYQITVSSLRAPLLSIPPPFST